MQEYYKLNVEEYLNAALPKMQKAIDTVASNFSGTSFPTENLFVGMECYRTDEKKIYRLTSDNPATWQLIWDLSLEAGQAVKDGKALITQMEAPIKTSASWSRHTIPIHPPIPISTG